MRIVVVRGRECDLDCLVEREHEGVLCRLEIGCSDGTVHYLFEGRDLGGQVGDVINIPDGLSSNLR